MNDAKELKTLLHQHTGSDQIFKHSLNPLFNYTEGVRSFAQNAGGGAYWLLDILASEPAIREAVRKDGLCVMLLDVREESGPTKVTITEPKAVLTVSRDADTDPDTKVVTPSDIRFTQAIDLTDCPVGQWKFYLTYTTVGTRNVTLALLPSEY